MPEFKQKEYALPDLPTLEEWLSKLWLIRVFEEETAKLTKAGHVPGFVHLSSGQEAVAVGVCSQLDKRDHFFSSHRGHGHFLAMGSDPFRLMAEILGREEGVCGGFGGSMHLVDTSCGGLGATGVVGGNIPLALGAAWAALEKGQGGLCVVFFGDGAGGSGVFHESLNLAALWKLPVLFVCENNGYAEFTSREEHSNVQYLSRFTEPYQIGNRIVDGNNVISVYQAARQFVEEMRKNPGPRFLECMTYRMSGHYVGDGGQYRKKEELEEWKEKDPIRRLEKVLLDRGTEAERLKEIEKRIHLQFELLVEKALNSVPPKASDLDKYLYSGSDIFSGDRMP